MGKVHVVEGQAICTWPISQNQNRKELREHRRWFVILDLFLRTRTGKSSMSYCGGWWWIRHPIWRTELGVSTTTHRSRSWSSLHTTSIVQIFCQNQNWFNRWDILKHRLQGNCHFVIMEKVDPHPYPKWVTMVTDEQWCGISIILSLEKSNTCFIYKGLTCLSRTVRL